MTTSAFLDDWLIGQEHRLRPTSLHSYKRAVARISSRLGKVPVQALTPLQIEKFYAELMREGGRDGKPLSAKTVRNSHVVLRKALSDAERLGLVPRNAAAAAKPPTLSRPEFATWSLDDIREFFIANLSHRLQTNTFVVGLTLDVLALGLTSYLLRVVEPQRVQAGKVAIPLLNHIPVIGEPLFHSRWPLYLLVVVIPLVWFLVNRTRWGLELRACGEDPKAADVTGIDVNKRRRQGVYIDGLATGLAGAYLSVGEVGLFTQNMTAGRGYLVNAAIIFGGWRLGPVLIGCVVFGGTDALRLALPAIGYNIQPQVLIVTPYVLAILAMCFFAKRSQQPRGLALPFERGVA